MKKVKLPKTIADAIEYTMNLPYYKNSSDAIEEIMEVHKSSKQVFIDNSHMLNELSSDVLYMALKEGYEIEK